ncbi:MAG: helix-turn-helix transcriptional regulator [Bacteroidota bacterium]
MATTKKKEVWEGLSKEIEHKLRVFDDKLAEGSKIAGIPGLTELLNFNRLLGTNPITDHMSKVIVKKLKELVDDDTDGKIKIKTSKSGYYYAEAKSRKPVAYRLFKDFIHREEENLLFMAKSFFEQFPSALSRSYTMAVDKILKTRSYRGQINRLENINLIEIGENKIDKGIYWVEKIVDAMIEKKAIRIEYKKNISEKAKRKILSPYILKKHESKWYLVAYDHTSKYNPKTNVFTLSKIEDFSISNEIFIDDAYFSAKDYFKYSIGIWHYHNYKPVKVKIQVIDKEQWIKCIDNPIHHTQKVISDKESIIEIHVYDSPELEKLILKYGPNIKVLAPSTLVEKTKETFKKALDLYS